MSSVDKVYEAWTRLYQDVINKSDNKLYTQDQIDADVLIVEQYFESKITPLKVI